MKKIFTLLAIALATLAASAAQTTTVLVDEEWTCADKWASGYQQIAKSQLPDLAAGDKIRVTVTAVSPTDSYPCVYLQYISAGWSSWEDFADTDNRSVDLTTDTTVPYVAEFEMTQNMVDCILAGEALVVKGSGYTGSRIEFVHYEADPEPTPERTLWEGELVFDGWDKEISIPSDDFASVTPGSVLKVHVTATAAQSVGVRLQDGSYEGIEEKWLWEQTEPTDVEFTLTSDILARIASTGSLRVRGTDYTVTKVSVVLAYSRDVTVGNYGTVCVPYAVTSPQGGVFFRVAGYQGASDAPTAIVFEEVESLEAGKPYLFRATAGQISLGYTGDAAAEAGSENGLVGTFSGCSVESGKYVISDNKVQKCGEGCSIAANRAYIDLAGVPAYQEAAEARNVVIFAFDGDATGISTITSQTASKADGKYMVKGQIVVVKSGKAYNVNGVQIK
ncbi:MAG: hypothetical protein IJ606_02725 [Bacteroidaceae bacterium]|nr:hypothetical protein [Bacteroidaceae bacterium]